MRKTMVVAASLLFVVASAFAQQLSRPNTVSVFVSDLTLDSSSEDGTNFDAAYGVALDHMFNDRLSGEISVTSQRFRQSVTTFGVAGIPTFSTETETIYPIDGSISYHFFTNSRWNPYLGAGIRYLSRTFRGAGSLDDDRFTTSTLAPEVSGGVAFQFTPIFGLRIDAKQIVSGSRSFIGDPKLKASVGLTYRF